LVNIEEFGLVFRPMKLLTRKHLLSSLNLEKGFIHYHRSNLHKTDSSLNPSKGTNDLDELPAKIYRNIQRYFPSNSRVSNFQIHYIDDLGSIDFQMDSLIIQKGNLH